MKNNTSKTPQHPLTIGTADNTPPTPYQNLPALLFLTVLEEGSGDPLKQASVTTSNDARGTYVESKDYFLVRPRAGTITVIVDAAGFFPQALALTLIPGEVAFTTVTLRHQSHALPKIPLPAYVICSVKDAETSDPLTHAKITVAGDSGSNTTAIYIPSKQYYLARHEAGSLTVTVKAAGYKPKTVKQVVGAGEILNRQSKPISLYPIPEQGTSICGTEASV